MLRPGEGNTAQLTDESLHIFRTAMVSPVCELQVPYGANLACGGVNELETASDVRPCHGAMLAEHSVLAGK